MGHLKDVSRKSNILSLGFSVTTESPKMSVWLCEGGRLPDLDFLHTDQDAPIMMKRLVLILTFVGTVSRVHKHLSCNRVGVDVKKT